MTSAITKSERLSLTWNLLYDYIYANLADPLTGKQARSSGGAWIKNTFPNPATYGKVGGWNLPIVVIEIPDLANEALTLDSGTKQNTISAEISTHSLTPAQAETMAEDIIALFETNESGIMTLGLDYKGITDTDNDDDFLGGTKYYSKIIKLEFDRID